MADLRGDLSAALTQALHDRDATAVAALRSALAAIANAEAVAVGHVGEHPFGRAGVGAAEASRRELTAGDVVAVVRQEIADRESAAVEYDRLGRADAAANLRREAATLAKWVAS